MKQKPGLSWYTVYSSKGEHQASYDKCFADAYVWAMDCAKHIGGYICECFPNEEEKVVFETSKQKA
jgi:hypothetical protein